MKAIVVEEIGSFEYTDRDIRPLKQDEVLVRVDVTGLCRTDLKIIEKGHRDLVLPRIPGEEVVGTITEIGPGAAKFEIGQQVYVYPGVWCGKCASCLRGAENLCREMQIMGFHRDGGFAEYVIVPAQSLIVLPPGLHVDHAVFAEPLSCCLNALENGCCSAGDKVGIWGAGPAGTLLSRAAQALGAEVALIEPDERRREISKAHWPVGQEQFDLCIVAVGLQPPYQEAVNNLAPRGRLVIFSGLAKEETVVPLDYNKIHYYEQTLVGAYGCCYRHGQQALESISKRTVEVEDMISHRLSLKELGRGLEIVKQKQGMKVLLYPEKE